MRGWWGNFEEAPPATRSGAGIKENNACTWQGPRGKSLYLPRNFVANLKSL